jgi:predicted RNase H-like nuclease (RuvC/YqgF family)
MGREEHLMSTEDDPMMGKAVSGHFKRAMLQQMAEALEDQAAALYRRVSAFEEEDFLVCREIEEHQTEINRLHLKLEAVRCERDSVLERVEYLRSEASNMREAMFNGEGAELIEVEFIRPDFTKDEEREPRRPMFFNRMTLP